MWKLGLIYEPCEQNTTAQFPSASLEQIWLAYFHININTQVCNEVAFHKMAKKHLSHDFLHVDRCALEASEDTTEEKVLPL